MSIFTVPSWVLDSIRQAVTDFIWNGKTPLIRLKSLMLLISKVWLKLCDFETTRNSFRIKLVSKLLNGIVKCQTEGINVIFSE